MGMARPVQGGSLRPRAAAVVVLFAASLLPLAVRAEVPWEYQVHLLTVGPGQAPVSRAGEALLAVARVRPGRVENVVYHFGEPEPDQEGCPFTWRGSAARVHVARLGTVSRAVARYASENRTVWVQRLRLTGAQIQVLRTEIAALLEPARQTYRYHPVEGSSATRIRDLLDRLTGGALQRRLRSQQSSTTRRSALAEVLSGCAGGEILLDLWGGHDLDRPLDLYQALHAAPVLRDELARLSIARSDGKSVALADPPQVVSARKGAAQVVSDAGAAAPWWGIGIAAGVGALGLLAWRRRSGGWVGLWLALGPGLLGVVGIALLIGSLTSPAAEARRNELLLSFLPTDAWLLLVAGTQRRARWSSALSRYGWIRLGLAGVVLLGQATGILFQQPRVLLLPSLLGALGLVLLTGRERGETTRRMR